MSDSWLSIGYEWERLLFLFFAAGAILAAGWAWRRSPSRVTPILLATMIPCLLLAAVWLPREPTVPQKRTPQKTDDQGYVSSETCRSCHPSQYASWYASYHRTMTQVANFETIRAPHQSVSLVGGGRRLDVRFDRGSMYADDVEQWQAYWHIKKRSPRLPPDFPRIQGEVVMTTGSHHMQLYWIPDEKNGGLTHLSWAWLIRDQRWVPGEMVYLQPPPGLAGLSGKWELNCIKCHSTGGQPRIELGGDPPLAHDPKVGELGIACESCHGPAAEHVAANRNVGRRYLLHLGDQPDPTIVNPNDLASDVASEICAACHSGHRKQKWDANLGAQYRPGDRIEDFFELRRFESLPADRRPDYFWGDGTSRVTGREYTGMIQSGCFKNGEISCLSCHSMHESDPNDQLARGREGDQACLQCHSQFSERIDEHTHHAKDSPGSRCYNCHMPNTTYGLLMLTRSHRIDSPSAANSARTGRPNACNLCHLDRTLAWADEKLVTWYGASPSKLTDGEREIPAGAAWLLKGDAVQRATAAWHFGWEPAIEATGKQLQPPLLARSLSDPYAAVRYLSERSLRKFAGYEEFAYDFTRYAGKERAAENAALAIYRASAAASSPPLEDGQIERLRAERDNSARKIRE